ncbi:MAG: hypothetical protein IRY99_18300 [Isosphaeraceae bacterium]|nr:hypothetical protein [Isosphaeraceae bacterium]
MAAMTGIALIVPVLVAQKETGRLTGLGISFVAAGCALIACGVAAVVAGFRRRPTSMPSGVRAAVAAHILVLTFLALELSDRSVRQGGKLFYWTTFLLPLALLLFGGLVAGRPWSWWVARGVAALGVLWFLGVLVVVPFAPLQADGIPVPWYGRMYVGGITVVLAAILASAFQSLGSPEARSYFGMTRPGSVAAAPSAAADPGRGVASPDS